MKELSIEQKEKAYDEAVQEAYIAYKDGDRHLKAILERIFPELKESEDERIRKAIMEFFELQDDNTTYSFISKKDILAWLEKQGKKDKLIKELIEYKVKYIQETLEKYVNSMSNKDDERIRKELLEHCINRRDGKQICVDASDYRRWVDWLEKQGTSYTKKDVDDAYLEGISVAKNEMEKQYEANYQIRKDIATFIFNYRGVLKDRAKWMDYLGIKVSFVKEKQKPNKKIEPEFHEGNFIVNDYCMGKVIEVTNDAYLLDTGQGIPFSNEHNAHLWTIEDAKDGDVLASDNGVIILVKESRGSSWGHRLSYHCAVLYDGTFEHREFHVNSEKFFPATKEQRDLLFSKMKEARYEWDAEKKKLKKIDDEEVNGEDYGIDGLWHAKRILEKTLGSVSGYQTDDGILDHKAAITAVKKLYEQKPTWTEEDGKKLSDILVILSGGENCYYNSPILINWLKSLKERI